MESDITKLKTQEPMNNVEIAPLFIVGLQKSGTTLLNRLLIEQPEIYFSPFKLEGRAFWGDDPPFSPTAFPCGQLYQKYNGNHGHELSNVDFEKEDRDVLYKRIKYVDWKAPILINKNPYNSVRISWLKAMFPNCKIVAMVRNPYANVYSLLKKHIPHEGRGLGPEAGWWGVKPKKWQRLVSKNKVVQLACQWKEVNSHLLNNTQNIDLFIEYKSLCESPSHILNEIADLYGIDATNHPVPELSCLDNEYKNGGKLLSKNREYKNSQSLNINNKKVESIEIAPLNWLEQFHIMKNSCFIFNKIKKISIN